MESKKLVLIGAGKIGRSFIGQLFSRSGYEVVFIDVDEKIVAALNQHGRYKVVIKSDDGDDEIWINNVRGVFGNNKEEVASEIASAGIMAISVGINSIPKVAPLIAEGLKLRVEKYPANPLDIILAENLRDAAQVVGDEVKKYLPDSFEFEEKVGLVETSIGKMVPIMPENFAEDDPLLVYAESSNSLILDKNGFKNPIPNVIGLEPKENMSAWVDRKSFIHNLGHAAAAYYGYMKYPDLIFLFEVMNKKDVYQVTRATMIQAADILLRMYPEEFTQKGLVLHIDDLLARFSNKPLGDTVFRVGQDLYRKLGSEDRLVGALKLALKFGMAYDKILYIIVCAVNFKATNEQEYRSENDVNFSKEAKFGISHILDNVCGISEKEYPEIHYEAGAINI